MISCVMAAHNAAATIAAAVDSVLRQTETDLELIVVDDGSTDGTLQVLAGIDDPRLSVMSQERKGPSSARNRALAQAKGEFVAPIDADDVWLPYKLELQRSALTKRQDAAVAYGWADFVDEQTNPMYPDSRARFEGNVLEDLLRCNFISCGSTVLVKRAALEDVGGYDPTLNAAEDWELYTRLAARYAFVAVPEVVVWYRRSPRSLTSHFWLMETNFLAANRKVFDAAPAKARALESFAKASFYRYLLVRAAQSKTTPGKWRALPRFAGQAAWHDPMGLLQACWEFCRR